MSELIDQISQNKSELLKAEFFLFQRHVIFNCYYFIYYLLNNFKITGFLWLGIYPAQVTEES